MQKDVSEWFKHLQENICNELLKLDSGSEFLEENWQRAGGGGGNTRIFEKGKIIEKGGVNFSAVYGDAPPTLKKQLHIENEIAETFFATGISIVIHPINPELPIIHMNTRYFEMGKSAWFGGGIDLTPHYINREDARNFHSGLKKMCDQHHSDYYDEFKKEADDYFFLPHRNETRGIGGIFFDQLKEEPGFSLSERFEFVKSTGKLFIPLYSEQVNKNAEKKYGENEKKWQSIRRGRYVEFNLIYDRGTKFGLETGGRTESILMSLPPMATWEYDYQAEKGSREENTLSLLKKGIDWITG